MKLAIMQPYFFPYIGYFQLISSVDRFAVYDDVSFIKQGWINRNRILLGGEAHMFSIPLAGASSYRTIKDTLIHRERYATFREKFSRTLRQAYRKAPYFEIVGELVQNVVESEGESISRLAVNSLKAVCSYLGLETPFVVSSAAYQNGYLHAQDRVLDICKLERANVYVNSSGGVGLYQKSVFAANGIDLLFLRPNPVVYRQYDNSFVPWLSIIDVLMFNPAEAVRAMLRECELA